MYKREWIELYPDGGGFGNISMRCNEKAFLISGTATGGLATLSEEKIIVMGGHLEGIISFGKDLLKAGNILIDKLHSFYD